MASTTMDAPGRSASWLEKASDDRQAGLQSLARRRRRRSPSISASACPTASACSGCRSARRSGRRAGRLQDDELSFDALFTTTCNWRVSDLLVTFTIGIVVLGVSAALFGGWLERAGPRKAGLVAAFCWGGGFLIAALGVYLHQLWIIWLGLGVIGGIGLGLGYISPVSTLVKWFPDRRGMATGMAIMGFGGGAMIGSPLANLLMNHFKTATSSGVVRDHGDDGRDLFRLHERAARSAIASRPRAGVPPAGRRRRRRAGR